ncbi:MAG: HEAT repeat domain-containing protein [Candidatus Diapherotrites archaeon]|nr:HEAT repeat domain-containing protein [Candidatus Diapherotrites archaeon]
MRPKKPVMKPKRPNLITRGLARLKRKKLVSVYPELTENLVKIRSKDPEKRQQALRELRHIANSEAVFAIIKTLKDPTAKVRRAALDLLIELRKIGKVIDKTETPTIVHALLDKDLEVRVSAAALLGLMADQRAVPALIHALRGDPSPVVQITSMTALGNLGNPLARIPIQDVLLQNEDPLIRNCAVTALEKTRKKNQ